MTRILGIGGVLFKSAVALRLREWYAKRRGVDPDVNNVERWTPPARDAATVRASEQ